MTRNRGKETIRTINGREGPLHSAQYDAQLPGCLSKCHRKSRQLVAICNLKSSLSRLNVTVGSVQTIAQKSSGLGLCVLDTCNRVKLHVRFVCLTVSSGLGPDMDRYTIIKVTKMRTEGIAGRCQLTAQGLTIPGLYAHFRKISRKLNSFCFSIRKYST